MRNTKTAPEKGAPLVYTLIRAGEENFERSWVREKFSDTQICPY